MSAAVSATGDLAGPLPLRDGRAIPRLGFGTYGLRDAAGAVEAALGVGYRLIDGAALYGNEREVGQGIARAGLPREQVFVTTKVWQDRQRDALASVRESLDRFKLDRVDLVLIHWPSPRQDTYVQAWRQLIQARDEGLTTSIGVSNFDAGQIDRLARETGETPVLNQVELHPRLQQPALRQAMDARGVVTQSWTPLGNGHAFADVEPIARRLNRTPAQVILRWHVEQGLSAIPRSSSPARIAENWGVWDFALTFEDHAALAGLDRGERTGADPATFG